MALEDIAVIGVREFDGKRQDIFSDMPMLTHPPGVSCNVFILRGLPMIFADRFDSVGVKSREGIGELRKRAGADSALARGVEVEDGRDISHISVEKFYCQYVSLRYSVRTVIGV
jgi:hypothetical protein